MPWVGAGMLLPSAGSSKVPTSWECSQVACAVHRACKVKVPAMVEGHRLKVKMLVLYWVQAQLVSYGLVYAAT